MVICSIDGILISSDYGRSWSTKNFIPAYCSISDVSISANCEVIICQVWNSRSSSYDTYLSLDKGNSWSIVNNSKISYINMNKGCILK